MTLRLILTAACASKSAGTPVGVAVGSYGKGVGECTTVDDGGDTAGISATDGACVDTIVGDSNAGGADPSTVPRCVVGKHRFMELNSWSYSDRALRGRLQQRTHDIPLRKTCVFRKTWRKKKPTSDGWRVIFGVCSGSSVSQLVRLIVGVRFPNVDVRSGTDVSVDKWETSPVGRGVADPADGPITSKGAVGTVVVGVSNVGDIIGA